MEGRVLDVFEIEIIFARPKDEKTIGLECENIVAGQHSHDLEVVRHLV